MEKETRNKIAIAIGIVLTFGILAWIGWRYWGWFGGNKKCIPPGITTIDVAGQNVPLTMENTIYTMQDGKCLPVPLYKSGGNISVAPDYMKIPTSDGKCNCFKHMGFVYMPDPAHPPDSFCYYKKTSFKDCPPPNPNPPQGNHPKAITSIPKHKSQDWHGAYNSDNNVVANKVLDLIGNKSSIFSVGETVNVEFRLSPNTPVVETITTKVVKILNPAPLPSNLIEINSAWENKYNKAYGRIYNSQEQSF